MNLRKTFLALGAMILGVGLFGAFPQPAHAITLGGVTCNLANDSSTAFPHNQLWDCRTTSSISINSVRATLRSLGTDAEARLKSGTGSNGQFYVFENYNNYFSFCTATGSPIACAAAVNGGVLGYTTLGSPHVTVIFAKYEIASGVFATNPKPESTTAHEAGHQLDRLYGPAIFGSADASVSTLYNQKLTKDWTNFDARTKCISGGLFRAQKDTYGKYICTSTVTATVAGTITVGNQITLTFTDPLLSPNPQAVTVTVATGDTLASVAQKLSTAINQNANLVSHHFISSVSGATITITSGSGNASTYTRTVTGTIRLNLGSPQNGTGGSFASAYVGKTNQQAVKAAWPQIFPDNGEIWSEEMAYDVTGTPSGNQDPGVYFQNDGFACTIAILHSLRLNGTTPSSYPTPCN